MRDGAPLIPALISMGAVECLGVERAIALHRTPSSFNPIRLVLELPAGKSVCTAYVWTIWDDRSEAPWMPNGPKSAQLKALH
jgi:hypothetical protein